MSSAQITPTEHQIETYLDGSLDAAGAIELARLLRGDGDDSARARELLSFAGLLGQALDAAGGEDFARSVDERLDAQGKSSAFVRAVERSLPARTRPRSARSARGSRLPLVAAAAAVLIAIGGYVWFIAREPARVASAGECRIARAGAGASIERPTGSVRAVVPAMEGSQLDAGDRVIATGDVLIGYADGSQVELASGASATVLPGQAGKRLRLDIGTLHAEVAPQPIGRPFVLTTTNASIEVIGTRFALSTSLSPAGPRTRLELEHGDVRMTRSSDGLTIAVHSGESALVANGESFSATPISTPISTPIRNPVVATAAIPAATPRTSAMRVPASVQVMGPWLPLFPAAALEGWVQQHGAWSEDGGVVHGVGTKTGAARLLGTRDLLDLELTCRLRIGRVEHAELQVGTYNWFFEIPAGVGDWIAVSLTQHGAELHCTAGGVELPRLPGAAAAPRPGAVAFYVMPGGVIDIADARIRVPEPVPMPEQGGQ